MSVLQIVFNTVETVSFSEGPVKVTVADSFILLIQIMGYRSSAVLSMQC